MISFFAVKSGVLAVCLMLALYYDIKEQKIKNFVTFTAIVLGVLVNALEQGTEGVLFSLKGWIMPIAVLMVLYYINVMGAGDIKLFAAIGAIMGLPFAAYSFTFSIYVGAVIALFILIRNKQLFDRIKLLLTYFRIIFFTGRISKYCATGDRSSKFIFTAAIVPGTIVQYILTLAELKGIILFN